MKRTAIILILTLLGLNASAQFLLPRSKSMVEAYGHISLTEGANYSAGGAAVLGMTLAPGFYLGIGAGLRYVHSTSETEDLSDGTRIRYYGDEAVAPIFVRARLDGLRRGQFRPFLSADIGMAVNFKDEGNTNGFFLEPQLGIELTENVYATLGVDIHHFLSRSLVSIGDVIDVASNPEHKVKDIMATGLSLHIGYSF